MDHIEVATPRWFEGARRRLLTARFAASLPPGGRALEAIVSLGAQLAVVAVREGTTPRFVRTVTRGDQSFAAARPGNRPMHRPMHPRPMHPRAVLPCVGAEPLCPRTEQQRLRRYSIGRPGPPPSSPNLTQRSKRSGVSRVLPFLRPGARLQSVALTGGGALADGVLERFASVLAMPVRTADVGVRYDAASLDLSEAQVREASLGGERRSVWPCGELPTLRPCRLSPPRSRSASSTTARWLRPGPAWLSSPWHWVASLTPTWRRRPK